MSLPSARRLVAAICCFWVPSDVSPLQLLSVTPDHTHIRTTYSNVTIMCRADSPLTGCQFRWRNEIRRRNGPVLDLSCGEESTLDRAHLNADLLWYHYSGEGLAAGECGVTLYVKGVKQYTVGCRVRAEGTGWRYGGMTLYAENYSPLPMEVSPPHQVAVGEEVSLMCKAKQKLNTCHFHLPGFGMVIMDAGRESPSPSSHEYYGAGLEQGECGLTLRAKEGMNGVLWCTVDGTKHDLEWRTIPLIVTRPPSSISMEVTTVDDAGMLFQATCTVSGSRPAANITWFLGERVLRRDEENDDVNATWTWPYLPQTITQTLNLTLTPGDRDWELRCEASHPALNHTLVERKMLRFGSTQCRIMEKDSVSFTCGTEGETQDCPSQVEVGTTAQLICKPGYVLNGRPGFDEIHCQLGGFWDKPILNYCIPDCGRETNSTSELATSQTDEELGKFPWHVGIYEHGSKDTKYVCGGSLITARLVISAAQCFWNPDLLKKKDSALFSMATGLASRQWATEDEQVQRRNISDIFFHDLFSGFETQFIYDIALARLNKAVHVTDTVNLVCVDWENQWEKAQLQENNTGMIVGQILSEDGDLTDNLHYVNLTYIQNTTCEQLIPERFKHQLTQDKFCAWSENQNRSLCPGDVGAGLVFNEPTSRKYYLRGVASVGFQPALTEEMCFGQYYLGFTSVSIYLDWIKTFA